MKNIVLFHLCFVFLYLLTPKVHAQVTYQSVCVENRQNSDGVNVCKLSPIYTSEWTQAGRNGVRGSVSEVIDEEIKRLTDPPSAICNLKYEVMPAEVIATDGFIHSEQPIEMKTLVLYDYSVRGPAGECNHTRYKGGFSVISRRTADCSSQQSGDLIWQSKWFSDIRSKACVRQEDFSLHSSATEGHCAASLYGFPGGAFPTYIGNPVEVSTGNKVEYELEFSDERPAPLSISRLYNSAWANGRAPHPPSSFGLGWSHSHEIWLDFDRNNVNPLTGDRSVKLKSGDHESVSINTSFGDVAVFHRFIPESTSGGAGGSYIPGAFVGDLKARVFLRIDNGWFYKNEYQDEFFFDNDGFISKKTLSNGDYYFYHYSQEKKLSRIENNYSRYIDFVYGADGFLSKIVPSHGDEISYRYGDGLLRSVVFIDGAEIKYLYEDERMLTGKIDENGVRVGFYSYKDKKVVSSAKTAGVGEYKFTYQKRITRITPPVGDPFYVWHSSLPGSKLYSSNSGRFSDLQKFPIKSVYYDKDGFVEGYYDYLGYGSGLFWDKGRYLPVELVEAKGAGKAERKTSISWHPVLRVPVRISVGGVVREMEYDDRGKLISLNSNGSDVSRVFQWGWDNRGNLLSLRDSIGFIYRNAYDEFNNKKSMENSIGHVTQYTAYDHRGRLLSFFDPNGSRHEITYDLRGRITGVGSAGLYHKYEYMSNGSLGRVWYANGYSVDYRYDEAQRLIGWSDNRGDFGIYRLDGAGNRVEERVGNEVLGATYKVVRDINNINLTSSITVGDYARSGFRYDENGDLTAVADGLGKSVKLTLDRLRRVEAITNERGGSSFSYDSSGLISQVKDFKGVVTEYGRDGLGNMTQEKSPDIGANSLTYDQRGLVATAKDAAGRTLAVQRDALGRPTQLQYGSTATSTLRYDLPGTTYNGPGAPKASTGHLSEIQDPGVTTQYQRDILGRVLRKSQILANGDTKSLIHSYVPAGQGGGGELQSITYPSGRQATYLYDSTGQITGLQWNGQPLVTGLTWSPLGQPTAWQWTGFAQQPGATATLAEQRGYNTAGQLASSQLLNLTWDAAGRISLIQQQHMLPGTAAAQQAKLSSAFSYDAVGRLTASAHSAPAGLTLPTGWSLADTIELSASGYAWDANGNRTQVHYSNALASGTSTLQRNYQTAAGTNRLQSYAQTLQRPGSAVQNSNVTFSYDAAGALVKKGDNHLHYGADGRIAKAGEYADAADARAVSYVYNALGQRVLKSDARGAGQPATLQTLYAEDGIGSTVLGQYANQRSANSAAPAGQSDSTEIIYLPTASGPMPIAAEINGRLYAIHTDHLNTPRRLTNQQGQVAWQWLISGFGEVRPTTGDRGYGQTVSGPSYAQAVKFDLRYPGQVFDEETGLSYNLHRYYDAATGRYMQADPIGLEGGWNRFGYVGGDPLSFVDPEGLQFLDLTTFAGARRNTTLDDAVRAGAWTRAVTLPAVTTGLTPSAIGLVGSTSAPLFCPATTTVTSWAPAGIVPDLAAGRWVMQGGPTSWNYIRTGVWGPRFTPGQGLSWPSYPLTNSVTGTATVSWPTGLANFWRGIFGQRQIVP